MSRNITASHTPVSMEAKQEQVACEGKLIFTKYRGRGCAILLKGSRILAMQALAADADRIGTVYVGKVRNVAKNINACFVEIAEGAVCFLPGKEAQHPFLCSPRTGQAGMQTCSTDDISHEDNSDMGSSCEDNSDMGSSHEDNSDMGSSHEDNSDMGSSHEDNSDMGSSCEGNSDMGSSHEDNSDMGSSCEGNSHNSNSDMCNSDMDNSHKASSRRGRRAGAGIMLRQGDELLVQVKREAHQTKQISLTAHISLSNEVAVISLGTDRVSYSAKLSTEEKDRIRRWLEEENLQDNGNFRFYDLWNGNTGGVECPSHVGMVVRTQAGCCSRDAFMQKLKELMEQFKALFMTAVHRTCFSRVMDGAPVFASVLDKLVYPYEYGEIVTDDKALYNELNAYCQKHSPDKGVRLYEDSMLSLYNLYSLESKIEKAFSMRVWLKSGGYLVIQHTEALIVIDVNSGKCERKKGFFLVNCEAAEEIAVQLRLRNLSGIIIVDFINMESREQRGRLVTYLRRLVRSDKQKVDVVDMTPLGLVEITRKRESRPLWEQFEKKVE